MIPTHLPSLPWQKVATDLYEWRKSNYLIIIDYYSRFIEVACLNRLTAEEVIRHMKSIFARHGIPEIVVSDNCPQFAADSFSRFSREYQFEHVTSSPYYPQGNGEAERAVQTVKHLLRKEGDPYLALLAYRVTPLEVGYSPAELLMSRQICTTLPSTRVQRLPRVPDSLSLHQKDAKVKSRQKHEYDKRHGVQDLPPLNPGDTVWIPDRKTEAEVVEEVHPRSYEVQTPQGNFRRNRRHLLPSPCLEETHDHEAEPAVPEPAQPAAEEQPTRTRSGRVSQPPIRLDPTWN